MNWIAELGILMMGWFIGLLIAMPVGPVAVLTFKRTLHNGWLVGVATAAGAIIADTVYAAVAAFGVYAVQDYLVEHQYTLRLIGGIALLIVGIRMLWQKAAVAAAPEDQEDEDAWHQLLHAFATGLIITLTNPLTLVAFLTILTNFGLTDELESWRTALVFVAGAFVGAATWWLSLVGACTLVKARISEALVAKINTVLAIFLVAAGSYAAITGWLEKPLLKVLH